MLNKCVMNEKMKEWWLTVRCHHPGIDPREMDY